MDLIGALETAKKEAIQKKIEEEELRKKEKEKDSPPAVKTGEIEVVNPVENGSNGSV